MKIYSYIKNSFVDYPAKICTTVFTAGCNMNCWFCHNYELIKGSSVDKEEELFEFLKSRVGQIDAVTITGGEPTLQSGLIEFIKKIKDKDNNILVAFGDDADGDASGYEFPGGINTVTYRVIDAAGLSNECSFTVTVSHKPVPSGITF